MTAARAARRVRSQRASALLVVGLALATAVACLAPSARPLPSGARTAYAYDSPRAPATAYAATRSLDTPAYDPAANVSQARMSSSTRVLATEGGGTALAQQTGAEGEQLAGIDQAAKVRIPSASGTAAYRIPDELTASTLTEVKNVANLSYTSQLRDFYDYAVSSGRSFVLVVRSGTNLSGPLQQLEDSGAVVVQRSLP